MPYVSNFAAFSRNLFSASLIDIPLKKGITVRINLIFVNVVMIEIYSNQNYTVF